MWSWLCSTPTSLFMFTSRRNFLFRAASGLGSVALSALLSEKDLRAGVLSPKPPHHPAKAKACIFLTMEGGPSHMDTFDPKPKLGQLHMTEFVRRDKFADRKSTRLNSSHVA